MTSRFFAFSQPAPSILAALGCVFAAWSGLVAAARSEPPQVLDERLEVTLFAEAPMIVTPIGIAPHPQDGILVIESHTHSPPRDYPGPKRDRILRLQDTEGNAAADRSSVFADGFDDAMNLAVSPIGEAFLIQRSGVVRLRDRDGDGIADEQTTIVRLETRETYDHSVLLGICLDGEGNLYLSRGNTGGNRFRWIGSDGSGYEGHGDGGDVVVTDREGKNVRRVATGFWNPFGLHWDRRGFLFATDNDPDAVGPNRVVHLIPGADFGFRAAYGSAGSWPLSAWNGELPGTLPLLAGVGEAPGTLCSGIDADLPTGDDGYENDLLVPIWGEHRVDRVRVEHSPGGLRGTVSPWIQGDSDFRPVAITAGTDGAIYFTDWVRKDYPNHGEGRIWRVSRRRDAAAEKVEPKRFEPPAVQPDAYARRLEQIATTEPDRLQAIRDELKAADPFVRTAAINALAAAGGELRTSATDSENAELRLAGLLAMRRAGDSPQRKAWARFFADSAPEVRIAALAWAADTRRADLRDLFDAALVPPSVDAKLVQVYLAADQAVEPEMIAAVERGERLMGIRRSFRPATIDRLLQRSALDESAIAAVLSVAGPAERPVLRAAAERAVQAESTELRREAVFSLGTVPEAKDLLLRIATDNRKSADTRADAIGALQQTQSAEPPVPLKLLRDDDPAVVLQTLRALREFADGEDVTRAIAKLIDDSNRLPANVIEELQDWADPEATTPPDSWDKWRQAAASGGDADAGRRVFFSSRAQCSRCHRWNGRGGGVGPDLSGIGAGHSPESLLRSILYPSEAIAPEYASHTILTGDGRVHTGIQFHFRSGGSAVSILTMEGRELTFPLDEVEAYRSNSQSLMPEKLVDQLSVGEVRDLVEMLSRSATR